MARFPLPEPSSSGISRRRFLRASAVGLGVAIGGPSLLGACGNDDDPQPSATTSDTTGDGTTIGGSDAGESVASTAVGDGQGTGARAGSTVVMLNWPLYLENDQDPASSPTIKGFTEKTGIKVDYQVGIDGNDSFYTKYEPELSKGRGIGADIVVLTSWMAARMIEKGFVQELDPANIPNRINLVDALANPEWDPGRARTLPWTTVLAGIGYYPEKVGFEITSINQLFDPKLKNRVTFLDEMRDTVGLVMLGMGLDPASGSMDDFKKAMAKIKQARDDGQIRKVVGNSYTEDLGLGDVWAAVAWAGDVATLQKDHPELKWVFPVEGTMKAVDTAMIVQGAENKAGAEAFLNHIYDAAVAAPLYEAINYPAPVKGATELMSAAGQASAFLNPPADVKLVEFRTLSGPETDELDKLFAEATQQ